jgi:pSer/pThr/pTyr-binding forkhead associated (FHA) protein
VTGGVLTVEDLASQNGVFVNEDRIANRAELAPGDRLRVGQNRFSIRNLDGEPGEDRQTINLAGRIPKD